MMRRSYILILFSIALLTSCSAPKLYQQGVKKIDKAIKKDPSIKMPTDTIIDTNTVVKIDTVDNEIIKTITNTITITRDTCEFDCDNLKTNRQLRWERKNAKDSLRHERKMHRIDNRRFSDSLNYLKQENRQLTKQIKSTNKKDQKISKYENKSSWLLRTLGRLWWLFLIAGFILGLYLKTWIKRLLPFLFKKKQDEKITEGSG